MGSLFKKKPKAPAEEPKGPKIQALTADSGLYGDYLKRSGKRSAGVGTPTTGTWGRPVGPFILSDKLGG